jgi:hypothetical protein
MPASGGKMWSGHPQIPAGDEVRSGHPQMPADSGRNGSFASEDANSAGNCWW